MANDNKRGIGKFVCLKTGINNLNQRGFHLLYDDTCNKIDNKYIVVSGSGDNTNIVVDDSCFGLDQENYYYIEYTIRPPTTESTTTLDPETTTTTISPTTTIPPTTIPPTTIPPTTACNYNCCNCCCCNNHNNHHHNHNHHDHHNDEVIPTTTQSPVYEEIEIVTGKVLEIKSSYGRVVKRVVCCKKQYVIVTKKHKFIPKNTEELRCYRNCDRVCVSYIKLDSLPCCPCTIHVDDIECTSDCCE
jgi:hypothetical protein